MNTSSLPPVRARSFPIAMSEHHHLRNATVASGALVGAALGCVGGPIGAGLGGLCGAVVGALSGVVLERDEHRVVERDREIDRIGMESTIEGGRIHIVLEPDPFPSALLRARDLDGNG